MPKLTILQGLPASGKSTLAKKMVEEGKGRVKRVNQDDLRLMIDNGKYSKANENQIKAVKRMCIEYWLSEGYDVVVDDCNFGKNESKLRSFVKDMECPDIKVNLVKVNTHVDECIRRDAKRAVSVGKDVILKMYYQHFCTKPKPVVSDPPKPKCYVVDMDGTLCDKGNRGRYEWDKVINDTPRRHVVDFINMVLEAKR